MKKIISSALIMSVTLSMFSNPVNAASNNDSNKFIYVEEIEENIFVDSNLRSTNNVAYETGFDDIYQTEDGVLLLDNNVGSYQVLEKITILYGDTAKVNDLINDSNIPVEVRNSIENSYNLAIESNNIDYEMNVFLSQSPKTRSTTYYNYGGERLKEVRIYHYDYNRILIEKDSSGAYSFGDRYGSATLFTAQQVFKSVNLAGTIYSGAKTLIDAFTGKTLVTNFDTSHSDNYVFNKIKYDLTETFEYVDMYQSGQFELGLHTNMVKSDYIYTEMYMYDSVAKRGYEVIEETHQNSEFSSPDYYSSPQVTIDSAYGRSNTEKYQEIYYGFGNEEIILSIK